LVHKSNENLELPIDIDPEDSVSNAGNRNKVHKFPDFRIKNGKQND
jgi:hypothetical protein